MAENARGAAEKTRRHRMGWPVVYAAAPVLAVGVALGLAAVVAEEGSKRELAGIEEESASEPQQPARAEAPADDETPVRQTAAGVQQDAPVAAATPAAAAAPADRPAASTPARDSTEQEAEGYVDPDAPVVEETAQHHVGDRRDPDAPSAVSEDDPVRHVGELLDPDAP